MSATTKKILVVDDASFMRTVLKDIIKGNGLAHEVIEAGDGALGNSQGNAPDPRTGGGPCDFQVTGEIFLHGPGDVDGQHRRNRLNGFRLRTGEQGYRARDSIFTEIQVVFRQLQWIPVRINSHHFCPYRREGRGVYPKQTQGLGVESRSLKRLKTKRENRKQKQQISPRTAHNVVSKIHK